MSQEFRYPLTRYCLRGGALTLPRAMVGLFPESGELTALDTKSDTEHILTAVDQRTITGLGPLLKEHRLAVNDELLIRALEDGRFSITPVRRERTPDYSTPEALAGMLDELIEASVPVTAAEVRALYQGVPEDVDLDEVFASDERFARREGRWHNALSLAYESKDEAADAGRSDAAMGKAAMGTRGSEDRTEATEPEESEYAVVGAPASVKAAAGAAAAETPVPEKPGASDVRALSVQAGATRQDEAGTEAGSLGDDGRQMSLHAAAAGTPQQPDVQAGLWHSDSGAAGTVLERRQPTTEVGQRDHERLGGRPRDELAANDEDAEDFDDGGSLEVTELSNRLRAVLGPVGFRLESVARGQLLLTADMGRKSYTVLAQLLTRNDRLDWADLLGRRRSLNVRYLAVVGDYRALHRLTNPAELARATMWSWQALDRLATLQRTVSFSPIELESHFERDGLFEKGLERFEAAVAQRVAERGAVSELLSRLAVMRSPSVFFLEELAGELRVPRDQLLRRLELLSEPPFSLVSKVDKGEFVLRERVADSLENLASYATSLRARLPVKQVEKLTGIAEPDLLTEDELEDQTANGSTPASA